MKTYAFIFARGGSKGLPGKNIKELAGKPLLQYSIEIAQASKLIDKVFVSTDDKSISDVALYAGANVIDRPSELAQDDTPEWLAWRHAIEWVVARYGAFDNFVSLPATSPLRHLDDVEKALGKREEVSADICIGVTPSSRSPYFNMVQYNDIGCVELVMQPSSEVLRRQDAPAVFDITTVVYASTPNFILNNFGLFSGRVASIVIPKCRAVDIDDIDDFNYVEFLIKRSNA